MLEKMENLKNMVAEIKEALKVCNTDTELDKKLKAIFYFYEVKRDMYAEGDWDVNEEIAWCEINVKIKEISDLMGYGKNTGDFNIRLEEIKM